MPYLDKDKDKNKESGKVLTRLGKKTIEGGSDMSTKDTTSTSKAQLTEAELELAQENINKRAIRIRAESEALQREREAARTEFDDLERRRAEFAEMQHEHDRGTSREISELFSTFRNEIMREMQSIRSELDARGDAPARSPSLPCGQRFCDTPVHAPELNDSSSDPSHAPRISYREATDGVPTYDGYNIPLSKFVSACRQARDILPPHYEKPLTRLLVAKLRGRAHSAVADEPCDTVTQLTDLLNNAFGTIKSVVQYRGELTTVHLEAREHMLDYIDRVKELRSAIMDGERRARGVLEQTILQEINEFTAQCFCEGLPTHFRFQLKPDHYSHPFEAFAAAKTIAKRYDLERQWTEPPSRSERNSNKYSFASAPQRHVETVSQRVTRWGDGTESPPDRRRTFNTGFQPRTREPNRPPRYSASPRDPPWNPREYPEGNQPRAREFPRATPSRERDSGERRISWRDEPPPRNGKWCRYCKNSGHEIDECRKRQYSNSRRDGPENSRDLSRERDATRADPPRITRPVNPIDATSAETSESQH